MKQKRISRLTAPVALALIGVALSTSSNIPPAAAAPGADQLSNANIFLSMTGETQGEIYGGSTDRRCPDCVEVYGFAHDVVSPRDAASGLPTGARQHKPLVVTKRVDKSTPLLFNVLVNNENIASLRLAFFRDNERVPYYTIELLNANVAAIRPQQNPAESGPPSETVSFTYQKIIWTWEEGGITAQDDWESPSV